MRQNLRQSAIIDWSVMQDQCLQLREIVGERRHAGEPQFKSAKFLECCQQSNALVSHLGIAQVELSQVVEVLQPSQCLVIAI
ncbi:MAG: hypothetical protein QGG36_00965 [Pirellulaceae bacterium]|jgi:hypothetical protein|nr:hypothetical protein [Pirellulaceae bacterium]MDP7014347.1 hypothetical protein [Pirellulaceae bacterium]